MLTDDFLRARLDQMIDLRHPLAVLARRMPWSQIEAALSPAFARRSVEGKVIDHDDLFGSPLAIEGGGASPAGRPRLPIRLMSALLYLKHAFNLSDEELVERWSENVVWQYFSGQTYYEPRLPCDATQIGRFRKAIGEAGVEELLKATIDTAVTTKAVRPQPLTDRRTCLFLSAMQRRPKRVVGEEGLPHAWRQLMDTAGRMLPDALQDIDEIVVRIDSMQSARHNQTLHDADVFGTEFGPAEHPVFLPHGNGA